MPGHRFLLFSTNGCTYCQRACALLSTCGLPYVKLDVTEYPEAYASVMETFNGRHATLPLICYVDGSLVGGYSELQSGVDAGRWKGHPVEEGEEPEWFATLFRSADSTKLTARVRARLPTSVPLSLLHGLSYEDVVRPALEVESRGQWAALGDAARIPRSRLLSALHSTLQATQNSTTADQVLSAAEKHGLVHFDSNGAKNIDAHLLAIPPQHSCRASGPLNTFLSTDVVKALLAAYSSVDHSAAGGSTVYEELSQAILAEVDAVWALGGVAQLYAPGNAPCDVLQRNSWRFHLICVSLHLLLNVVPTQFASDSDKLPVFLNLYNALVRLAKIQQGFTPDGMLGRYFFFSRSIVQFGGLVGSDAASVVLSLDTLENGLLRANRKSPMSLFCRPFSTDEVGARLAVATCDARIHAALNCGAASCPPVRSFNSRTIDDDLTKAAKAFFQSTTRIVPHAHNPTTKYVYVSKIVDWYRQDFGERDEDIVERIKGFLAQDVVESELRGVTNVKLCYLEYDWS